MFTIAGYAWFASALKGDLHRPPFESILRRCCTNIRRRCAQYSNGVVEGIDRGMGTRHIVDREDILKDRLGCHDRSISFLIGDHGGLWSLPLWFFFAFGQVGLLDYFGAFDIRLALEDSENRPARTCVL